MPGRLLPLVVPVLAVLAAAPAAAEPCIPPEVTASLSACAGAPSTAAPAVHVLAAVPAVAPPPARGATPPPAQPDPRLNAIAIRRGLASVRTIQLLVSEIQGLETLLAATEASSLDRPRLLRRVADTYVELEAAQARKKIEHQTAGAAAQAQKAESVEVAARKAAIRHYVDLKDRYPRWCQVPGPPASGCVDETLYNLAYEQEQAADLPSARAAYLDLVQTAPGSKYVPHAYLAFGELFFQEAQADPAKWTLAEQSYKEVTRYPAPDNKVLAYARYKLAYVYWNKGDFAQGISELKKTIDVGQRFPTLPNAAELAASARRDLVPLYALAGDPKKAHDFLRPVSGDPAGEETRTVRMMAELGQAYLDIGHYADGIEVYRDLLRRDPGDRGCGYQARITEATLALRTGDKPAAKAELDRQLDLERRFRAEAHPDDVKRACANESARLAVETAMIWHLEAVGQGNVRGTMSPVTMGLADDLYGKVVQQYAAADFARFEFPRIVRADWPTLLKVKAARADLLYARKEWDRCGPAFDAVVAEDPRGPTAAEAAYASALCYERALLAARAGKPYEVARGADLGPRELSPRERAMLASFDRFLCVAPADSPEREVRENRGDVAYARARTYFEARRWPEAAAAFRDVALSPARHESGLYAAQLYLEALNVMVTRDRPACLADMKRDLPALRQRHCSGESAGAAAEGCASLARVQRDVTWKDLELRAKQAGEGPEHAREWEAIAEGYLALWSGGGKEACEGKQPGCERMEQVLYNAARAFGAARLVAKGIAVRQLILDPRYHLERTPVARQATLEIGKNHQAIAAYEEAATWYERFAREAPEDPKAPEALEDALVLRLGLGQEEQALRDAEAFDRAFRRRHPADAARIAFALGAHHVEHDDLAQARRRLSGAMADIDRSAPLDVQIQAHALLGRVLWQTGGETAAVAELARARALYRDPAAAAAAIKGGDADQRARRVGKMLTAVGEALFFAAEQRRRAVDAIQFPAYRGSGRRDEVLHHVNTKVQEWMKRKMPAIEEVEREYRRIVELEPAPPPRWVIAAGARVGQMWGRFVAEFRAAPVPKEWRQPGWEEVLMAYYEAIDRASEPYRVRAKDAYHTCLSYSARYQHFDEHSRACEVWLSKSYPQQYHVIDELRPAPARVAAGIEAQPALLAAPAP